MHCSAHFQGIYSNKRTFLCWEAECQNENVDHGHLDTSGSLQLSETKKALESRLEKASEQHCAAHDKAAADFSRQLKAREMEIGQLESMHTSIKVQLEARVSDLESKLSRAKEGWKQAEHRRALDSEGFTNDISLLRKQLAAVDRKLHSMRLKSRLEDDERLEGLLKKVAGKGTPLRDQVRS